MFSDKPEVVLSREGRNNDSLVITPAEDVSLKCSIDANPGHHTVQWTRKVREGRFHG